MTDSTTIAAGTHGLLNVYCPAGQLGSGGGYSSVIVGGLNDGLAPDASYATRSAPEADGSGWFVQFRNNQAFGDKVQLTVYAVCIG